MGKFKKLIITLLYRLKLVGSAELAKLIGVRCGQNCKILDNPMKVFGTEPYIVKLGNDVEVTNGCRFITHDGALWCFRRKEEYKNKDYFKPITVGNNVFIGVQTIILPGVTIGDNVIIGAGSVVTKDIPSDSVACGVPCKVVKSIEDYSNKLLSNCTVPTKGMNYKEKKNYLWQNFPEWFEV